MGAGRGIVSCLFGSLVEATWKKRSVSGFRPGGIVGKPTLPGGNIFYFLQLNSELSIADPGQKSFTTSLYNKTSLQNLYFE